ncbi:TolC family protein [Paludibacterium sp. B53371]|uniref:TolC family protein n=1 Tax=Paludibacterium sp. B53371 TaxID=2806263 RepID=UPI001C03C406|nr:TolC family protein [Paludibacterium sp. B53371]
MKICHAASSLCVFSLLVTPPASASLSLPEVAARAMGNSPEVRIKLHQYLGAEADVALARAGFFPQAELSHVSGREQSTGDGPTRMQRQSERWAWSLNLTQNLFSGFQTVYSLRQQDHAKTARYYQLLDVSEQQALEAVRAYLDVMRQRELLQAARTNHDSHRRIYQKIRSKVRPDSGVAVAAGVDLEQAGGRLALAEANLLTVEANLADVSARYARIVGEAPPARLQPYRAPKAPEDRAIQPGDTPAVRAALAAVQAARQQVQVRRGAFLPRVDARARQEWGRLNAGPVGRDRSRAIIELSTVLNLSRGGADKAQLQRAAEDLNAALAQQDKSCREVRQQVQMAQTELDKLQRKLSFLRQHALASEKVRDAYWDQFEISKRSLLDVLDSENEFFRSRSALIDGETDLVMSQLRLQAAAGRLLGVLGIAPARPAPETPAGEPGERVCSGEGSEV